MMDTTNDNTNNNVTPTTFSWADQIEEEELRVMGAGQHLDDDIWQAYLEELSIQAHGSNSGLPKRRRSMRTTKKKKKRTTTDKKATEREKERLAATMAKQLAKENAIQRAIAKETERAKEQENKLFFGGIVFADLMEKFATTVAAGEEDTTSTWSVESSKEARTSLFLAIVGDFGRIRRVKPNWAKRYCHVIYEDKEAACRAFDAFSSTEKRKHLEEEMRKRALAAGIPSFVVPLPTFYVRWPKEPSSGKKKGTRGPRNDKGRRHAKGSPKSRNRHTSDERENESAQASLLYWSVIRTGDWSKLQHREDTTPSIVQKESQEPGSIDDIISQGPKGRLLHLVGLPPKEVFAVDGSSPRLPLLCSAA